MGIFFFFLPLLQRLAFCYSDRVSSTEAGTPTTVKSVKRRSFLPTPTKMRKGSVSSTGSGYVSNRFPDLTKETTIVVVSLILQTVVKLSALTFGSMTGRATGPNEPVHLLVNGLPCIAGTF